MILKLYYLYLGRKILSLILTTHLAYYQSLLKKNIFWHIHVLTKNCSRWHNIWCILEYEQSFESWFILIIQHISTFIDRFTESLYQFALSWPWYFLLKIETQPHPSSCYNQMSIKSVVSVFCCAYISQNRIFLPKYLRLSLYKLRLLNMKSTTQVCC